VTGNGSKHVIAKSRPRRQSKGLFQEKGPFHGQVAVVTGASSGIGRAIALDLARCGAEVCLVARRRGALEDVRQEVANCGGQAHVYSADLTRDDEIGELCSAVQARFSHLDVLVLCAGVIFHATTEQSTLEQLDLQYRSNVRGHYEMLQALLPLLRRRKGQIVFVNSSMATRPSRGGAGQFVATQYALRAIADSLRDEVNADGIRVLSIYPGRTATARMPSLFEKEGRPYRPELLMQPEDVATMITHSLCMPRTAEVTDISMRSMTKCY
jgi:NADP-dependent 3-hydroxy acid dehydrogenase YdfG